MASSEIVKRTENVNEEEDRKTEVDFDEKKTHSCLNDVKIVKEKKKKKKRTFNLIPKLGCMKLEDGDSPAVKESHGGDGSFDVEVGFNGKIHAPTHLVVMVNGIIGSAQNWRFAAKQFVKAYPKDVIVHCSESNSSMLTFDGVDVMGKRLADEVISVVKRHPSLQKISFIGHSLGGLVARYAIACLYKQDFSGYSCKESAKFKVDDSEGPFLEENPRGKIAGLEPVNFITSATPHLGSRGHKQVPVFCGIYTMERVASKASWLLGRTGKHLFLADREDGKPPLLLQMVNDHEDLKFISALQSFRRRVAYANVRFDHLVGWSSSSLRPRNELPKRRSLSKDSKYPHIFHVDTSNTANHHKEISFDPKTVRGKTIEMEEKMMKGLTQMSWERVDVNFQGSTQRFLAHNTIQVKTYCINSHGADVIRHMIDNFIV